MRWSPPEQNAQHAVLGRRPVAGQQDDTNLRPHAGVVHDAVQLVDGVRPKRVADLGPVERDAHRRLGLPVNDMPVVGDVGQVEPVDGLPHRRVKGIVAHAFTGSIRNTARRPASASNSSGLGPVTRPAFLMKPTPDGTSTGNARSSGRASSVGHLHHSYGLGAPAHLQRGLAGGPGVGGPIRAGHPSHHVPPSADGHRRDGCRARLAGLAAGNRQHHGSLAAEADTEFVQPDHRLC